MIKNICAKFALFLFGISLLGILGYRFYQENFPLFFIADTKENLEIKINDMNVRTVYNDFNENIININPKTTNTLYPNKIQIGTQTKYRRFFKLNKKKYLSIYVKFNNGETQKYHLLSLPQYFPECRFNKKYNKGYVLTSLHGFKFNSPAYAIIYKANGKLVWYRGNENTNFSAFHIQQHKTNNNLRYSMHVQTIEYNGAVVEGKHILMDEKFNIIKEIQLLKTPKHPAILADEHDFIYINDNHYIIFGYLTKKKYLSQFKKVVKYLTPVIQEIKNDNVVFEWIGDEHPILFKAALENEINKHTIPDYIHINSIEIDPNDNNLIISSASGHNIFKIDRKTGKILWILGGKLDDFNLTQEQTFIRQHDIQILDNNKLLLFDNGYTLITNNKEIKQKDIKEHNSRAILFNINEKEKSISNFKEIPFDYIAKCMGSVQLLQNDKILFGCGCSHRCIAKLKTLKNKTLMEFKAPRPYFSYRSYWVNSLK